MPWHLAILGAGSAAAYYLNTLDRSRYPKIVVIGEDDPWAGRRGMNPANPKDPVNFINQSESMIGHFGPSAPATSDQLVPRADWAKANQQIIDQCSVDKIQGAVLRVSKAKTAWLHDRDRAVMNDAEYCYAIEVKRKNFTSTYYAPKVVVATGAGEHKAPDDRFPQLARRYPDLFMDMDTFARHPEMRKPGKKIIVQGPNAAVDSVDTAAFNQCTVYWLTGTPAILATPHQTGARAVRSGQGGQIYALNRSVKDPAEIKVMGNKIQVKLADNTALEADHYVWGIGQDSQGAVKFLDSGLLNNLEPIYDVNQRFGDAHESVLGFQLEGTTASQGLEVVGALARQVLLARKDGISHTYLRDLERVIEGLKTKFAHWNQDLADHGYDFLLEPVDELSKIPPRQLIRTICKLKGIVGMYSPTWNSYFQALGALIVNWAIAKQFLDTSKGKVRDEDLNNALKILTPSTVGSPQLGGIRAATSAMSGFMPVYVANQPGGDANFSHDDQTVLRVFIAVNYPCVPEEDCQRIIAKMIEGRRSRDKKDPNKQVTPGNWGYQDGQIQQFRSELKLLNDRWAGTFSGAKTSGTGKTTL